MELKEFVKLVLADITNAVKESQTELNNGSVVAPILNGDGTYSIGDSVPQRIPVSNIDFEVSITANNEVVNNNITSKGINVASAILNMGAKGDKINTNTKETENASKIRFTIPVAFSFRVVQR